MLKFRAVMLNMIQAPYASTREALFEEILDTTPNEVAEAVLKQTVVGESSLEKVLTRLASLLDVSKTEALAVLGISRSCKSKNPDMSVELLDRTYSALTLFARVASILGQEGAKAWFGSPKAALDGARPVDLLSTRVGVGKLQNMLTALEDGTFL